MGVGIELALRHQQPHGWGVGEEGVSQIAAGGPGLTAEQGLVADQHLAGIEGVSADDGAGTAATQQIHRHRLQLLLGGIEAGQSPISRIDLQQISVLQRGAAAAAGLGGHRRADGIQQLGRTPAGGAFVVVGVKRRVFGPIRIDRAGFPVQVDRAGLHPWRRRQAADVHPQTGE